MFCTKTYSQLSSRRWRSSLGTYSSVCLFGPSCSDKRERLLIASIFDACLLLLSIWKIGDHMKDFLFPIYYTPNIGKIQDDSNMDRRFAVNEIYQSNLVPLSTRELVAVTATYIRQDKRERGWKQMLAGFWWRTFLWNMNGRTAFVFVTWPERGLGC